MKSILKPIEFLSPLSEIEVKMTLRDLSGFSGEVDQNSFRLINSRWRYFRRSAKPILMGHFSEQNGKTKVTVSVHTRITDVIGLFILIIWILASIAWDIVSTPNKEFLSIMIHILVPLWFIIAVLTFGYFFLHSSFQRSVKKIKKALLVD